MHGKEVITLINEELNAGTNEVVFDKEVLTGGIYFCQIRSGNFIHTKKMILSK